MSLFWLVPGWLRCHHLIGSTFICYSTCFDWSPCQLLIGYISLLYKSDSTRMVGRNQTAFLHLIPSLILFIAFTVSSQLTPPPLLNDPISIETHPKISWEPLIESYRYPWLPPYPTASSQLQNSYVIVPCFSPTHNLPCMGKEYRYVFSFWK